MFAEILRVIVMLENFQGIDFWLISHSIPFKKQVRENISSFSGTTSPVITFLQESFTAFKLHFLHSTCLKELCLREEQNYLLLYPVILANIYIACYFIPCFIICSDLPLKTFFFKMHLKSSWSFSSFLHHNFAWNHS